MRIAPIALICLAFAAPAAAQPQPPQGELGERTQSPEALFREMVERVLAALFSAKGAAAGPSKAALPALATRPRV